MKIDCISDLHGYYPKLEGGDLLIVAGDLTATDLSEEHFEFLIWLIKQKYTKIIFIGGNHDNNLIKEPYWDNSIEYLCDSGTEFEGLKIWGSPWTKSFMGINPKCMAFTKPMDIQLDEKWQLIPSDIDILITHGPPHGILDGIDDFDHKRLHTGSPSLRNHVMGRIKPKMHVFGHIHEHGRTIIDTCITKFINCCHVNRAFEPVHAAVTINL